MKRTARGFALYAEVKDDRGVITRIQRSSAIGARRCWVFVDDPGGVYADGKPAPHLSPAQARRVAAALLKFAGGDE